MKRFRNLTITGAPAQLHDLAAAVCRILPPNWKHDVEAEERLRSLSGDGTAGYAFARDGDPTVPPTGLLLMLEASRLWVPNIVPRESGQISVDQYNGILLEFALFVEPLLQTFPGLRIEISSDQVGITEWVSPQAAELLKRFSTLANMSTGSSHPYDFRRWAAFIVRTHKDGSKLYPDDLRQWLVEGLGWPPEPADKLSLEYEFARSLLEAYDQDEA